MELIRLGQKRGFAAEKYADPAYDVNQMWEIMEGMKQGLHVELYLNPRFNDLQMKQIRLGLAENKDVGVYAKWEIAAAKWKKYV